jgi:hypothetical protein
LGWGEQDITVLPEFKMVVAKSEDPSMRRIAAVRWKDCGPLGMPLILHLALLTLLVLSTSSCDSENPTSPGDTSCPPGQWAPDTGNYRAYRHDCEPYTDGHFTIYSDGASQTSKATLASMVEGVFSGLTEEWGIGSDEELHFTPGYTYYIYAHRYTSPAVSEAYRNGFLTVAVDYGASPGAYQRNPSGYLYVLKHELTHVFQFTLTNCPSNSACPTWLDVWFREGQAVVTGGGFQRPTLQGLNDWRVNPDHINPIRISRWNDFPNEDRGGEYYSFFALAYAWLVDAEEGHGATIQDIKDMFRYMAEGDSFHGAFERALGISVGYLEENFFSLMEAYLE